MEILTWIIAIVIAGVLVTWWDSKKPAKTTTGYVNGAVCTTCGQMRVRRLGKGEKVASGVAGGVLFSKKARSQFQCDNCKFVW